jgi:putative phosphonate metabolism protein
MNARYAVYYAPAADDPLARRAAAWLGRDAFTGEVLQRPALDGLDGLDLGRLTQSPRGYGFHATLKAPFELAPERSEAELVVFAEDFAARQPAFTAPIAVASLGRFIAFRLTAETPGMRALEAACVRDFDAFRAPISEFDLARRRKAPLTPEQDARLVAWGYPYVFEDFRFHMTLTDAVRDPATAERLIGALRTHFADLEGPHRFDSVALFKQDDRSAPFQVLARFAFEAVRPECRASFTARG